MSYTNVEILSGVLVVACLMLFWCQRSKGVDGFKPNGYSNLPMAGHFSRDGYVVGSPNDPSLSYTARSSYFSENAENRGLNDMTTTPTPASEDQITPDGDNTGLWLAEAKVNDHKFSTDEERDMYNNVFARQNNRVTQAGETVSGSQLHYIDYGANMVATRQITM